MNDSGSDFQLDQAIGMHLNRAAFLMTDEIARRFSDAGWPLSAQDFGIMFRLRSQGAMTQVEIAALMLRDKTTITRRIDGLVKKQLVERRPDPDDRRYFRIMLTPRGEKALDAMIPLVRDFQHEVLSDVPEADREATLRTLRHISELLISRRR